MQSSIQHAAAKLPTLYHTQTSGLQIHNLQAMVLAGRHLYSGVGLNKESI